MGVITLENGPDPIATYLQQWMANSRQDKMVRRQMDAQESQFQRTHALDRERTDLERQRTTAQTGLYGAQMEQTNYAVKSDRAKSILASAKANYDTLMSAKGPEAAAAYAQAVARQYAGDAEVQALFAGMTTPRESTPLDAANTNAARFAETETGLAASGSPNVQARNIATKMVTGEQLSGVAFGDQQQREAGDWKQFAAVQGGRAPDANTTAQIAGQERMNNARIASDERQADAARSALANIGNGATGQAVLAQLPPAEAALVRGLIEYRTDPKSLSNKGGHRERYLALAQLVDPTYDERQYGTSKGVRRDFTSGKAAANIRSLNTGVGHLAQLAQAAEALKNGDVQILNQLANNFGVATGAPAPVVFEAVKNAVAGELATVFKGTGGTDQEISHMNETMSRAQSPDQVKAVVGTYIKLLGSRLHALQSQYDVGMGNPRDFEILNEESRGVFDQYGVPHGGGHAGGGRQAFARTATNPNTGQQIGSNDGGKTWVDVVTGERIK